MNKYLFFLFLLLSCNNNAQDKTNVNALKIAYSNKNENAFLENFPNSFTDFKSTFGWNDKLDKPNVLYDSANEYIDYYFKLVSVVKNKIFKSKVINISINGKWEADAVGYFQDKIHNLIENDKDFVLMLNDLNQKDINSFWSFYFDSEKLIYPEELNIVLDNKMQKISKSIFDDLKKQKNKEPENIVKNKTSQFEIFDKDGYTNLRSDKYASAKIINKINSGEEITIIESIDEWWEIKTKKNQIGYVHKSRIRVKSENSNSNDSQRKEGFKSILEKKCDLNQDGKEDKITVYATDFKNKIEPTDYKQFIVSIRILDKVFKNKKIIEDYYPDNVATGFTDIKIKDNYFTIEQANGSGNGIVREFTTFKFSKVDNQIVLHKYTRIETIRSSGDEDEKTYNYSSKDFGKILFEDFIPQNVLNMVKKK